MNQVAFGNLGAPWLEQIKPTESHARAYLVAKRIMDMTLILLVLPFLSISHMVWVASIRDWRLEIGDWRLEIGDWRLEIGITAHFCSLISYTKILIRYILGGEHLIENRISPISNL